MERRLPSNENEFQHTERSWPAILLNPFLVIEGGKLTEVYSENDSGVILPDLWFRKLLLGQEAD